MRTRRTTDVFEAFAIKWNRDLFEISEKNIPLKLSGHEVHHAEAITNIGSNESSKKMV